jgi:voltage-gated potassium channel
MNSGDPFVMLLGSRREGLSASAAKIHRMAPQSPPPHRAQRWILRRVETKGLRPRYAAYLIAGVWTMAVVVFGTVEHLVDPDTFPNVWLGMWWALETVTTVGYGDVVPADTAGKVIASFLLLGGLSLLAVVTGVVTSAFVTQAQVERQARGEDPMIEKLDELSRQLDSVQAEIARGRQHGE